MRARAGGGPNAPRCSTGRRTFLPARFDDAWDLARQGEVPETDAAHPEVAQVSARTTTAVTAVVAAHLELRSPLPLLDDRLLGHVPLLAFSAAGTACSSAGAIRDLPRPCARK